MNFNDQITVTVFLFYISVSSLLAIDLQTCAPVSPSFIKYLKAEVSVINISKRVMVRCVITSGNYNWKNRRSDAYLSVSDISQ